MLPKVCLSLEHPQLERGMPSDTDTPPSSAGPAPHCNQRPLRKGPRQSLVSLSKNCLYLQGFISPKARLTVEHPQLERGVPSDTDTPPSSAGAAPSRKQRPLREVMNNGVSPSLLERAASLSESDQEQSMEAASRPASGEFTPALLQLFVAFVGSFGIINRSCLIAMNVRA